MGTIQNTFNTALGAAAKGATAVAGIQAMQAGESVKALKERNELETEVKSDIQDLKDAQKDVRDANKEVKKSQGIVKSLEDEYNRGVFGTDEFKAEWDLDMRSQMEDAGYALERANQRAEMAKKARLEQKQLLEKRKEDIKLRVEAYNKTARRRGVSKIKMEELYKGGKK